MKKKASAKAKPITDPRRFQKEFYARLGTVNRIDRLLDRVTGVYFFVKDRDGLVVAANQLTVERCGCQDELELVGKTDYELFPHDLADKYVRDDKRVMETGVPIENAAELAPNDAGELDCFITNKMPLHDREGNVIGIAGVTVSFDNMLEQLQQYADLAPAIRKVMKGYAGKISIPDLGRSAGMPARRFSEQFKDVMKYTPQTFVVLVRLHYGTLQLIQTDRPISEIAQSVGFYDHSEFTRQFKRHIGMSPLAYRREYRPGGQ